MVSRQQTLAFLLLSALTTSSACLTSTALANSDPFYQALAKTQKQQFDEAIKDLDSIGRQAQKQGKTLAAYRSQATASMLRYNRGDYKESSVPEWYHFGACWGDKQLSCDAGYGVEWAEPPTKIKGFGGIINLDKHLGYKNPDRPTTSIRGLVDTVVVPKLQANESVVSRCQVNSGKFKDDQAVALVTYDAKQQKYTKIRRAWYPNLQTNRIESIGTNQVTCADPEVP
jgi:hypothetical protein